MKPLRITTHSGRYAVAARGPGPDGKPAGIGASGFASHVEALAAAPGLLADLAAGVHLGPLSAVPRGRVGRRAEG